MIPTHAQRELLVWMVARENRLIKNPEVEFSGGDLIEFYRQRKLRQEIARYEARNEPVPSWIAQGDVQGGYANHGWRRAGGTALANLQKRGFVVQTQIIWGTPYYKLTDEGRDIGTRFPPVATGQTREHGLGKVEVREHRHGGLWWVNASWRSAQELWPRGQIEELPIRDGQPVQEPRVRRR